jgi:hypothetical protein
VGKCLFAHLSDFQMVGNDKPVAHPTNYIPGILVVDAWKYEVFQLETVLTIQMGELLTWIPQSMPIVMGLSP